MTFIGAILWLPLVLGALLLAVPTVVFAIECLLALLPIPAASETDGDGSNNVELSATRFVVVVPAHDESLGIARTLEALLPVVQASAWQGRVLVVADNCTDDTAIVARRAGAEVIERQDSARRGKGYALAFAAEHLAQEPPDVLVFIDADCIVEAGAIQMLVHDAAKHGRPAQGDYTLVARDDSPNAAISSFAFLVRNRVRPRGLAQLRGPCGLFGTGMAMPYALFQSLPDAEGHLVEDMWLGVACALAGRAPRFVPHARVVSDAAPADEATKAQRTRWEHGHLSVLTHDVPRLLRSGQRDAVLLGLDLSVPPLALLVALHIGYLLLTFALGSWGSFSAPFTLTASSLAMLVVGVAAAWFAAGREVLPMRTALSIPKYVLWKLPIYAGVLRRRATTWIRTERESHDP